MNKILLYISIPFIIISTNTDIYSISASLKSQQNYSILLNHLRTMRIVVENFGNDEQKKGYEEIKKLFQDATEEYYGQNFDLATKKFYNVYEELCNIMKKFASIYLKRAEEILDSTAKESFDILIKYGTNSGFANYFKRPYDPIEGIKAYEEKEYHLFHDRETIERYLNNGYKKLGKAKKNYYDPNIELLNKKKKKTTQNLNYIIDRYANTITFCKLTKLYGIEIYKIINMNQIGEIILKYDLRTKHIDPIFDDRIPQEYKRDANDNLNLIHSVEKKRLLKKTTINQLPPP
ncbi:MAG: hypothetical protein SVZ03_15030 [Spirochaetota bacterium]|nr:hypothetical protein [Spirochaetota bacterium]